MLERVSPNNHWHKQLLGDMIAVLDQHGFFVGEKVYHDGHLPESIVKFLARFYSPTALYLRSSADRFALCPDMNDPKLFFLEAKSAEGGMHQNIAIEALPLGYHCAHATLFDVQCLYGCRDYLGKDRGFWASQPPNIRCIFVPPQKVHTDKWCVKTLTKLFPDVDIVPTGHTRGSGDPFAIIDWSEVSQLPTWQELICAECGDA